MVTFATFNNGLSWPVVKNVSSKANSAIVGRGWRVDIGVKGDECRRFNFSLDLPILTISICVCSFTTIEVIRKNLKLYLYITLRKV